MSASKPSHSTRRLAGSPPSSKQSCAPLYRIRTLASAENRLDLLRKRLREHRHAYRDETISRAATGDIEPDEAGPLLDSVRWLHRVAYHVWRIVHHLRIAESEAPRVVRDLEPAIEVRDD